MSVEEEYQKRANRYYTALFHIVELTRTKRHHPVCEEVFQIARKALIKGLSRKQKVIIPNDDSTTFGF